MVTAGGCGGAGSGGPRGRRVCGEYGLGGGPLRASPPRNRALPTVGCASPTLHPAAWGPWSPAGSPGALGSPCPAAVPPAPAVPGPRGGASPDPRPPRGCSPWPCPLSFGCTGPGPVGPERWPRDALAGPAGVSVLTTAPGAGPRVRVAPLASKSFTRRNENQSVFPGRAPGRRKSWLPSEPLQWRWE